jgi:hypothetical protein
MRLSVMLFAIILAVGCFSLVHAIRAISRDAGAPVSGYLAFGVAGIVSGFVGCIAFLTKP